MASPHPLPVISGPEDHKAFFKLINSDFPDTYDKWFDFHTKEIAEFRRMGESVHPVEVYPDEFERFCKARGRACTLKSFLDFAIEKAAGNKY